MQRVTVAFDDDLLAELDRLMARRAYQHRSEAIRDLARSAIQQAAAESEERGDCVAVLVYVYDHSVRELPKLLSHAYHNHHDLSVATMQSHLDQDNCVEMTMLRGDSSRVRDFAQRLMAERGVRHGQLMSIPLPSFGEAQKDEA